MWDFSLFWLFIVEAFLEKLSVLNSMEIHDGLKQSKKQADEEEVLVKQLSWCKLSLLQNFIIDSLSQLYHEAVVIGLNHWVHQL